MSHSSRRPDRPLDTPDDAMPDDATPADDGPTVEDVENAAVDYLARRDHARGELRDKLRRKGFEDALIDEALDRLEERRYLDDARFASLQGALLAARGWGPAQVRHKLASRHVARAHIEAALAEIEEARSWEERCRERLEARFGRRGAALSERDQQKAFRFLTYRGYPPAVVRQVLFERD